MENLIRVLADTGIANWQQGSTHVEGRAILWQYGRSLYSTIGTWDEYQQELNEDERTNPFVSQTREASLEPITPSDIDDMEQTLSEAILWREVGDSFDEQPGGQTNPRSIAWKGEIALIVGLAEQMIYADTAVNANSFLRIK